jgi:hypothetical protein
MYVVVFALFIFPERSEFDIMAGGGMEKIFEGKAGGIMV